MQEWSQYIGIPFKPKGRDRTGCDCWGLHRMISKERFGVELPSYDEEYLTIHDKAVCRKLEEQMENDADWQEVFPPQPGDIIILRIRSRPFHVGTMISDREFIHIEDGVNSCLGRISSLMWSNKVVGYYRYIGK